MAFIFKEARTWEISEVSHLPRQPWDITIKEGGENCLIDYLLSIDEESELSLDDARESLKEHFEAVRNFGLEPTREADQLKLILAERWRLIPDKETIDKMSDPLANYEIVMSR